MNAVYEKPEIEMILFAPLESVAEGDATLPSIEGSGGVASGW